MISYLSWKHSSRPVSDVVRLSDFGPLEISDYKEFLEEAKANFDSTWMKKKEYTETLTDFELIELLGCGSFGKVVLVRNKKSQRHRFHAMKIIEKKVIVDKKQISNTKTEKNLLQSLRHPLLINLEYFFQDPLYLYFIMPHIVGGELFAHLRKVVRFEEAQAQFYSAQLVLALEFLHYIQFVHRDIKPENILIDHTGYLKLCDFGFCKKIDKGRTYTLCGTPEYMAPEIISHKGYGTAVDWWALGVLIYELNAGTSPFVSRTHTKVFRKIISHKYKIPVSFSEDLKDIIKHLLQENISLRYGNLKDGVDDIKQHKWFRSVNWLALLSRKMQAPYHPTVRKPRSNPSSLRLLTLQSHVSEGSEKDAYKELFEDF